MMMNYPSNMSFSLKMLNGNAGQAAINFQSLNENTWTDETEGGNFFEDSIIGGFVENNGMNGFILYFAFRPLLLFGGLSAARCRSCFCTPITIIDAKSDFWDRGTR
jgi:hypothetical protein